MLLLKKAKLKVPLSSGSESNLLFAIASAESDLRICMILNQALSINLSLAENLQIIRKQQTISFRRYSFEGAEGIEKPKGGLIRERREEVTGAGFADP